MRIYGGLRQHACNFEMMGEEFAGFSNQFVSQWPAASSGLRRNAIKHAPQSIPTVLTKFMHH